MGPYGGDGPVDTPAEPEAHTPLRWDDGADGQAKGVLLGQVRLRRADVVQWKGFATDRWDADEQTRLVLMGNPPTHVVIEDVGGEHLCLSFDGIAFKYYQVPTQEAEPS